VVFEIMTKVVKERIDKYFPIYKNRLLRWMIRKQIQPKTKVLLTSVFNKKVALYASFSHTLKETFLKSPKT